MGVQQLSERATATPHPEDKGTLPGQELQQTVPGKSTLEGSAVGNEGCEPATGRRPVQGACQWDGEPARQDHVNIFAFFQIQGRSLRGLGTRS